MRSEPDATPRPLRILHLEDEARDAELARSALELDGLDCRIETATNRADFVAALGRGEFDLILSDYGLPGFDGLSALRLASDSVPGTPFILLSGTMGEEAAIESLQSGATDYVLKHRMSRLGPAVRRALREAQERRTRRQAEVALDHEKQFLRAVLESVRSGLIACDAEGVLTLFKRAAREIHGIPPGVAPAELPGEYFRLFAVDGTTPIARGELPLQRILRGEAVRET